MKLINSWFKNADASFPLIFCQAILAIAKGQDEYFKKGSIEFLRNLAIKKPDYCSLVGGFKVLINSLLDDSCMDIADNIFYSLLFVVNNPEKRKYLNNLTDFYKIFSIFTKSDFSINQKDKDKDNLTSDSRNKLEVQLALSKRVIEKLLKTWPGYSLLMGNFMALNSIVESINTDTHIIIKKTVLDMLKELIEEEYHTSDNFTQLTSGDEFYVNKVYLAHLLQGLHNNNLYLTLIKFIEKENNPLSDYAQKIALKFIILYSKLSNIDLQLPFLNHKISSHEASYKTKIVNDVLEKQKIDEELINSKIKIMNLLDQTFYHFNCQELSQVDVKDLSDIVVLSLNSVVNLQHLKKYNNQYSVEVSKRELYMIDDSSFQLILKNSKILDYKDFYDWDWKVIDEILDILEYRKELSKYSLNSNTNFCSSWTLQATVFQETVKCVYAFEEFICVVKLELSKLHLCESRNQNIQDFVVKSGRHEDTWHFSRSKLKVCNSFTGKLFCPKQDLVWRCQFLFGCTL